MGEKATIAVHRAAYVRPEFKSKEKEDDCPPPILNEDLLQFRGKFCKVYWWVQELMDAIPTIIPYTIPD
jgi:hypothetical protein